MSGMSGGQMAATRGKGLAISGAGQVLPGLIPPKRTKPNSVAFVRPILAGLTDSVRITGRQGPLLAI